MVEQLIELIHAEQPLEATAIDLPQPRRRRLAGSERGEQASELLLAVRPIGMVGLSEVGLTGIVGSRQPVRGTSRKGDQPGGTNAVVARHARDASGDPMEPGCPQQRSGDCPECISEPVSTVRAGDSFVP